MKREAILDFFIFNGRTLGMDENAVFDQLESLSIYEVIRLVNGIPLFLEEHLSRMRCSAELLGYELKKTDQTILEEIVCLSKMNQCENMNIKLLCTDFDQLEQSFLVYFVESYYPLEEVYHRGIATTLYKSERENPNAKTMNIDLREGVNRAIKEAGGFEVILVNKDGCVTEGSRSNIFFVKEGKVYTAPSEKVLKGVTRMKIMSICKNLNIPVIEKAVNEDSMEDMDGAFITGTSIGVLPITSIGELLLKSVNNIVIKRISDGYKENVKSYLRECMLS